MRGMDLLALLSCILEPGIAGYALRLNRVFGCQRVGWCVFCAFSVLALLHLVHLLQPGAAPFGLIDCLILGLLLLGMASAEALCAGRVRLERKHRELQAELERLQEQSQDLGASSHELLERLAAQERAYALLKTSQQQFEALFAENPLPMWIFDLRSLKILAANQAAAQLYGLTEPELMTSTAKHLHDRADLAAFLQSCARPANPTSVKLWRHHRRDGKPIPVEVNMLDLRFDDSPSRLIVARERQSPSKG